MSAYFFFFHQNYLDEEKISEKEALSTPYRSNFHNILLLFPVGNITTGNWTCYVSGLYQLGITSLIAHFKIAGMQIALEAKINVIPKTRKKRVYQLCVVICQLFYVMHLTTMTS